MKLKTLRDFEGNIMYEWQRSGFVQVDKLREEAIKWVRTLSKARGDTKIQEFTDEKKNIFF